MYRHIPHTHTHTQNIFYCKKAWGHISQVLQESTPYFYNVFFLFLDRHRPSISLLSLNEMWLFEVGQNEVLRSRLEINKHAGKTSKKRVKCNTYISFISEISNLSTFVPTIYILIREAITLYHCLTNIIEMEMYEIWCS